MYGYVRAFKPELKFREYDVYRSYYCGLCHCLKEKYGMISRMALSYDMVFLILLLTGLYEPETKSDKKRCIVSPKKHSLRVNPATDYAADMLVIYSYIRCCDNKNDEKKIAGTFEELAFRNTFKKVPSDIYRDKIENIFLAVRELEKIEKQKNYDYDTAAHCTGEIISEIFSYKNDIWLCHLKRIGYFLGKFIFILDAYEDIEYDIKKGNYNPFFEVYQNMECEEFDKHCHDIMFGYISQCADEFEMLPIEENVEILRNILYLGVWNKFSEIREKRRKKYDGSI